MREPCDDRCARNILKRLGDEIRAETREAVKAAASGALAEELTEAMRRAWALEDAQDVLSSSNEALWREIGRTDPPGPRGITGIS